MNYKKYQYKILCEDKAHYYFVLGWLEKKGAHRRVECYGELPHDGSGKSFVEKNFPDAKEKVRKLTNKVKTFLIVIIDADNLSIDDIIEKLPSDDSDPVFLIIPKWSIDTWARYLMEEDNPEVLDETKSCKNIFRNKAKFIKLGKQLAEVNWTTAQNMPASLKSTFERIKTKKKILKLA